MCAAKKKRRTKFSFSVLLCLSFSFSALCQVEREEPATGSLTQIQLSQNRIIGKILSAQSNKGLDAVSIQLFIKNSLGADSLIRGLLTKTNGDFNFENLPKTDSLKLEVSGIGYTTAVRTIVFNGRPVIDVGNISLAVESQVLSNVIISTPQRQALQMGIDRKIYDVERNITATGGTALDVMRNIPSVSVDAEGAVQLRNAQPQIFVDGRPTILTPDQIAASDVERIELITNPSSKFDASSSAGIINIVMKRNRRIGLNGVATIGGGHPSIWNGNLSLNARQGKVNLFVTAGFNQNGGVARGRTLRQNKTGGVVNDFFNQNSSNNSLRRFGSLRFGVDFFASNRTTISFTQQAVKGFSENKETQDQQYLNSNEVLERYGNREANAENRYNRYNSQVNFTHRFAKPGKEFTGNLNYNYGDGTEKADILNVFYFPNGSLFATPAVVRNRGNSANDQYTLQLDYVNPTSENGKLEFGARSYINKQHSLFSSFSLLNNSILLRLPLGNNYAYTEKVNAAYISYQNKKGSIGYQLGLRTEISRFDGELIDSAKSFGYSYPSKASRFIDGLFPSVFLTKKMGESAEVQLNYTRRIRRPDFWQLNPFIDINDPVNLRRGNPELQPEFVNSFEFNYSQDYKKGNFLGVIYYRNNLRDITRFSDTISAALYQQLNNAAIDPNALLNTFINARSTNRLGLELTLQHKFTAQFDIVPTIDMQYRKVNAGSIGITNSGFNWEAELTTNFRFANTSGFMKNLGLQLIGEYESAEVTVQGRNLPQYQIDFGFRKEFLKDKKAAFSFNINDIFNTQRFGSILDTETFYQDSYRRRNVRSFRLSFTYKFGKDDFKILGREDRKQDNDE